MINLIKSYDLGSIVAIGGPFASAWQKKCFAECPLLDVLFIGESDYTITDLVDCIKQGVNYSCVKGIIYKGPNSELIKTPPAPIIHDLDALPLPARDLIDNYRK